MLKIQKSSILAIGAVSIVTVLIALMAYPAYAAKADYQYALNPENWMITEESSSNLEAELNGVLTVKIDAKGYAFQRIDGETLEQYNTTTSIVIQVQRATETTERKIDVTGLVKINEATYTITRGKVVLAREKRLIFLNCTGTDENGSQIILKFRARYFWWGGKAYALRSIAILQTAGKPMLLLQRGLATID